MKRFSVCTEVDSNAYAREDVEGHWVRWSDVTTLHVLLREALDHITAKPWDDSTCLHARISVALGLTPEYNPGVYGFDIDEIQREAEAKGTT